MSRQSFWQSGHRPTLVMAFLYFDLSFMVWVLLGPLAVQIGADIKLDAGQKGLMVALPVLAGALLRPVMGVLVDYLRPKRAGAIGQVIVILALLGVWLFGVTTFEGLLLLGCLLGVAGAAFAVALPLASRWYPPEHQGTALGIAGAGNSGTALAALFAPGLALAFGWQNVFGIAAVPLIIVLMAYLLIARDAPETVYAAGKPKSLADYLNVLQDRDAWWFMFFYSVTFGGFVGLASSLTIYFNTEYGATAVVAGYFTAACVFAGSFMRPVGGWMADRMGGIKSLSVMYVAAAILMAMASFKSASVFYSATVFLLAMIALGCGNGAVFQLVPQRFRKEIGVMTGLVGMAGGIGGFALAAGLGYSRKLTGSYQLGLLVFAALCIVALAGLTIVKTRWRTTWGAAHLTTARI